MSIQKDLKVVDEYGFQPEDPIIFQKLKKIFGSEIETGDLTIHEKVIIETKCGKKICFHRSDCEDGMDVYQVTWK